MAKRRAVLASGRYHIWNLTWDDLTATKLEEFLVVPQAIATKVEIFANAGIHQGIPSGRLAIGNAWQQITGFIQCPQASGWRRLAEFTAAFPLEILAGRSAYAESALHIALNNWRSGQDFIVPASIDNGEWICYDKISGGIDVIALSTIADCLTTRRARVRVTARLDDSDERLATQTYRPRWRKFLSCLNLLQFCGAFSFFTTSEVEAGTAPDVLPAISFVEASGEWAQVRAEIISSLRFVVDELAAAGVQVPQAAYEDEAVDENAVAELAWLETRIAVLGGEQALLVAAWQANAWTVVTANEIQAKGTAFLIELIETRGNN